MTQSGQQAGYVGAAMHWLYRPEISGEHGDCALPYIGSALPGRVGQSGTFAVFPAYRFDRPG